MSNSKAYLNLSLIRVIDYIKGNLILDEVT